MILRKTIGIIFINLLILGCATGPHKICSEANWKLLGQKDGEDGLEKESLTEHQKTCQTTLDETNKSLYLDGWAQGNKIFCTAEGGYKLGVHGGLLSKACPVNDFSDFFEQFKLGRQVYELTVQRAQLRKQITESNNDTSTLTNISRAYNIFNGRSPTRDLDEKIETLNEKISAIDNNAPGGPQFVSYSELNVMSLLTLNNLRKYGGATLGTVYGFGLGHAIQGRYSSDGWKWTAGEVATLGTLAVVSVNSCGDTHYTFKANADGVVTRQLECQGNGPMKDWMPLAIVTWLGFRVWQSYDLFSYPGTQYAKQASTNQMIVFNGVSLAWVYQF